MLNETIRILNFDDSILKQQRLISRFKAEIIDLKDLGPRARLWMDKKAKGEIERRIRGSNESSITFLGSGDFHHISDILISRFEEPLSLIVFDFHPDWDILPPRFGCGSWITEALKSKQIAKCALLGVSSLDISSWHIQRGNLGALKGSRLEIFPYEHKPSLVCFRDVPANLSLNCKKLLLFSKIYWSQLKGRDLKEFSLSFIKRIPTKQVYLSIDKDCLRKDYALTNWEEGGFNFDELSLMLSCIKENLDIVGLDIVGDYSFPKACGYLKNAISSLDHPSDFSAKYKSEALINAINEETNIKLLELFRKTNNIPLR
jgi:hypothetical protein